MPRKRPGRRKIEEEQRKKIGKLQKALESLKASAGPLRKPVESDMESVVESPRNVVESPRNVMESLDRNEGSDSLQAASVQEGKPTGHPQASIGSSRTGLPPAVHPRTGISRNNLVESDCGLGPTPSDLDITTGNILRDSGITPTGIMENNQGYGLEELRKHNQFMDKELRAKMEDIARLEAKLLEVSKVESKLAAMELSASMHTPADFAPSPFRPSQPKKSKQLFPEQDPSTSSCTLRNQTASARLPSTEVPTFDGDMETFATKFARWARITGVEHANDQTKMDWMIVAAGQKKYGKLLEKLVKDHTKFEDFWDALSKLFPKIENDVALRESLKKKCLPCPEKQPHKKWRLSFSTYAQYCRV